MRGRIGIMYRVGRKFGDRAIGTERFVTPEEAVAAILRYARADLRHGLTPMRAFAVNLDG